MRDTLNEMTRFAFLLIVFGIITSTGFCQVPENIPKDTLSCINLTDGQGMNYKIVQTVDLRNNLWADSTRVLVICYNSNKSLIHLPIPDEEVKNFSIEGITEHTIWNNFDYISGGRSQYNSTSICFRGT